jgi:RND family efflux transporter MFP subunit
MRFAPCVTLFLAIGLGACGGKPEPAAGKPAGPPATLITTTTAESIALDVTEDSLGTLEALIDPKIGAEVAGRVIAVHAKAGDRVRQGQPLAEIDPTDFHIQGQADAAEIARLDALVAQAERFAERQQRLVAQGFISKNGADDALAQRDAARAQLATARARSGASRYNLGRSKVVAPVEGVIETQIVAAGDYVKVGDPLYRLVSNRILKAHLPYPESAAARIRPGQPVRLTSPQQPDRVIEGSVEQVKPTVSEGSRALDVQVRLDNDGGLRAGGTVNGAIVTGRKPAAVVVPEQSVVLRPAGKVVYVVAEGKARQRIVEPGVKRDGRIEIVKGLAPGEVVAEDGAGFLSDGAAVTVKAAPETRPATAAARP